MDVAVIGMGRVGTALATLLSRAGHRIVDSPSDADAVLITTPDDRIAEACSEVATTGAFRAGQFVAHASGAIRLGPLRASLAIGSSRTLTSWQGWSLPAGGQVIANPISYSSGAKQQVAIAAGDVLIAFALEESGAPVTQSRRD